MKTDLPPDGLHPLEYARGLLQKVLAWPAAKTNLELIGDCVSSLMKTREFSGPEAYRYLRRAIALAKEQGIPVDRFFFLEGGYTNVRPQKEHGGLPVYERIDRKALEKEQSTPEWQAANAELRAALAKFAGRVMP